MRYFFNLPTPQEDRKSQILVYVLNKAENAIQPEDDE